MTSIIAKSMVLVTLSSSPFPRELTIIPSLTLEHTFDSGFFISQTESARTLPDRPTRWNPELVRWQFEAGWQRDGLRLSVGHYCEHGIDGPQKLAETANFLSFEYRRDFF